ncbi:MULTISPECIES: hypothetical protein [Moorena]|uniref:Uncharacterized protein n=1 Tax=Moorena producens (strain JHB) TaxID=1454205 RepID=A0A9Q9SSG1_MOOP1|nr:MULTISPECIES: hypothetical protein [Moorena]NER89733.1 hypothetical protein [Moorena sp. SIO3A2]WAN68813.1 hypothetical protein BJP36_41355 [Moorena producens JHB]
MILILATVGKHLAVSCQLSAISCAPCSQIRCSQIRSSLLPTPYSLLPTPYSLLPFPFALY